MNHGKGDGYITPLLNTTGISGINLSAPGRKGWSIWTEISKAMGLFYQVSPGLPSPYSAHMPHWIPAQGSL